MEALHQKHADGEVRVFIIDVNEDKSIGGPWAAGHNLTFPVLLDTDGKVSTSFAPEGILPDLPRDQIPIGSNLIIDREGKIQFYSLLDTKNFDARLVALKEKLYALIAAESPRQSTGGKPNVTTVISLNEPELVTLRKGGSTVTTIAFTIKDGFHVLADAGREKSLIPLRIDLAPNEHVTVGELSYPKSEPLALLGSDNPLGVYSGEVGATLSLSANSAAKLWQGTLEGQIVFQSCNDRACFPPDSLRLLIPIRIIE